MKTATQWWLDRLTEWQGGPGIPLIEEIQREAMLEGAQRMRKAAVKECNKLLHRGSDRVTARILGDRINSIDVEKL